MRPVSKLKPGDICGSEVIRPEYNPYRDAKPLLEQNLGGYCSFCERPAKDEAVHIEHVQPKSIPRYQHLTNRWDNFLLSCARCNGKDNKGAKDVVLADIHLPHRDNTVMSILYEEGGLVRVNHSLPNGEVEKARALIQLVGLDKRPGHPEYLEKDKRWDRRREVWEIAQRYLANYELGLIGEETIIDLARGYGFWSVWYSLFKIHSNIVQALVEHFSGTSTDCFDADFNLVTRPPLEL